MRYKSLASIKVRVILDKSEFSNVEIVRRIRENSTPVLRNVCNIDLKRLEEILEEILEGDQVTFLEASIIMQAVNEDIGRLFGI